MRAAGVVYPTLAELRKIARGSVPTLNDIEAVVLEHYGLSCHQLTSLERGGQLWEARAVAAWLAYQMTCLSPPQIGDFFHRSNVRVRQGYHLIERRRQRDEIFATELARLMEAVYEEAGNCTKECQSVLRLLVAGDSEVVSNPSPAALEAAPAP